MSKRIISILLVCVTLVFSVNISAFAKVSVPDVKNFSEKSATSSSITLKWDKVKTAKGYRVFIYDSKSKKYKSSGFFTATEGTVSSLSAAKSYKFRIKAYVKENGKRVYSKNYASLTAVTATEKVKNVKVSQKQKTSFVLSWDKAKGADGYTVQRFNIEKNNWYDYKTTDNNSLRIKKEGYYRVVAYREYKNLKIRSAASSQVRGKFKYVYSEKGTFTFTVYGYGHGVGMSQVGAEYYAKKGWNYKKIITHYYKGSKVVKDKKPPEKVSYGEKKYSLKQYLYRVTQAEIGNAAPIETIKAQVVACYSYAKYHKFKLSSYEHAFSDKSKVTDKVKEAVDAVTGEYAEYKGSVCLTPYFSMAAGKTASCENTWGGKLPYLSSVESPGDRYNKYWKSTYTVSSEDFKKRFFEDYGEELSGDPSKWIKIISHDKSLSSKLGYVTEISVGSLKFRGEKFRTSVMHYALRSNCFVISYKAK